MSDEARPPGGPRFACDAMLAGLARWLRAAGYDASWSATVTDRELIRLSQSEERLLLSPVILRNAFSSLLSF